MLFLPFSGFGGTPLPRSIRRDQLAMLEEYTAEDLARTPLEELAATCSGRPRPLRRSDSDAATTLQRAAKDSYRLNQALDEPMRLVLGTTLATITTLQQQLKAVIGRSHRELVGIPQTLSSIPGLGPVWTADWWPRSAMISRFADEAALAPVRRRDLAGPERATSRPRTPN